VLDGAAVAWYILQPRVFPPRSPSAPRGKARQVLLHVAMSAYWENVPLQLAWMTLQ